MRFTVIDMETNEYPDLEKIAKEEKWANPLFPFDMPGFSIDEDGVLCLEDDCNNYAYCPHDRFKVIVMTYDDEKIYEYIY